MQSEGLIFIVSAPSGSGKTTLLQKFLEKNSNVARAISATTRKPRLNERNGVDYYFHSVDEFKKLIEEKKFVEWTETYGHYYGTLKEEVDQKLKKGISVVLNIDVVGAKNIKKIYPKAVTIFIRPPSIDELEKRLKLRKEDSACDIEKRIVLAREELEEAKFYSKEIINDKLENAVNEFTKFVEEKLIEASAKKA